MSVILGSARSTYNSPKLGDQSGKEVSTQGFYLPKEGYWLGFEPKDKNLANKLAQNMQDACDNNYFGYSQPYRLTGRQAVVRYGSIKGVKELCAVDCSSLVNLCLYCSGHNVANFNTASEPKVLRNTGLFTEKRITKESQCTTGMILCTPTKGHTMIVVKGISNTSANTTTNKKTNEQIAKEVIQGKWGNGNARKCKIEKAGYNYEEIRALVNKMMKGK